ncbi:hypothetical protein [Natronorubrum sp. A-ect3]|uniref:hypothetical protein n=1 Tax=Natronorubrum sp. A-ect3 TaxID=3242698 RepID=UPI00359E2C95
MDEISDISKVYNEYSLDIGEDLFEDIVGEKLGLAAGMGYNEDTARMAANEIQLYNKSGFDIPFDAFINEVKDKSVSDMLKKDSEGKYDEEDVLSNRPIVAENYKSMEMMIANDQATPIKSARKRNDLLVVCGEVVEYKSSSSPSDEWDNWVSAEIEDESGSIDLMLHDWTGEKFLEDVDIGTTVRVCGKTHISEQVGNMRVNYFKIDEETNIDTELSKRILIEYLETDYTAVPVAGEIISIGEEQSISTDIRNDVMTSNILIGDESGFIEVVFWDNKSDVINRLEVGNEIRLTDASVKSTEDGMRLDVSPGCQVTTIYDEVEFRTDIESVDQSLAKENMTFYDING